MAGGLTKAQWRLLKDLHAEFALTVPYGGEGNWRASYVQVGADVTEHAGLVWVIRLRFVSPGRQGRQIVERSTLSLESVYRTCLGRLREAWTGWD